MAKGVWSSQGCEEGTALNPEAFRPLLGMREGTRRPSEALTAREKMIAARVAMGRSNAEIAGDLKISVQTVKNHMGSIFEKVGVTTRLEVATWLFNHDCRLCPLRGPSDLPQHQKRIATELPPSVPADVPSSPWRVT